MGLLTVTLSFLTIPYVIYEEIPTHFEGLSCSCSLFSLTKKKNEILLSFPLCGSRHEVVQKNLAN